MSAPGARAYTGWLLDEPSRIMLLLRFPPRYQAVAAHHVTLRFGVPDDTAPPPPVEIRVIGHADSPAHGIEALVVTVGGRSRRPDGGTFHITWSFDPGRARPSDANRLIAEAGFARLAEPVGLGSEPATFTRPTPTERR